MIVTVKFHLIKVNYVSGKPEIVFPYGNDFYRMDWDKVPEKFKILYVVWLKLSGKEIPEHLKCYERDTVDVSDTNIEIDLDYCEKVPPAYPTVL